MPSQSANLTALRAPGHKVRAYAAFFLGASVLTGTVSATPAETAYPITTIAYTTSTGSSANVRRGYRVIIKTAAGVFKFACTVRNSGTISSVALPIRESSRGSVRVASGDLIEVRSIMQPGDKLTEANSQFLPDGLAYSNQNSVISPVCCSGGAYAGFVDSGQTYATVAFVGSTSYTLDEDSSGTVTHLWTFSTATGTTTSTSADPSFTFPVGEHTGTHVVTDTSNSATATQVIAVKVFDDTTLPYDVLLDSPPRIDLQSGASCSIELFSSATLTDIPDGTMVCIFMRETINGVQTSYGSATTGRSHILMTGYTNGDTIAYADGLDTLTMDIVSPLQWYAETLGLSKVGLRESSPDSWQEIEGLTCWMMCIQILRWYTWLMDSWDVTIHAYLSDEDYPALFISEQDAISQVRELVHGLGGRFVELRHGWFQAQPRLEMLTRAHRLLQPTTLTLGDDDILEYEFRRDHRRRVARVRVQGFRSGASTSTAKPMFAVWPGDAPGSGTTQETIDKQIRFSPSDFFEAAGHIGADIDRVYVVTDGSGNVTAVHHAWRGTLVIPGYLIFDLYPEFLAFDSGMSANLRGAALSDARAIIEAIDYEISDEGVPTTTLDIKAETFGDPGVDDTPPAEETNNLPPYTSPDLDLVPITTPPLDVGYGGLRRGTVTLALILSDGTILRTGPSINGSGFDVADAAGGPLWDATYNALTLLGSGTSVADGCVNSNSPGYPASTVYVAGGAINGTFLSGGATSKVANLNSIFGTPTISDAVTLSGDATKGWLNFERGDYLWGALGYWNGSSGIFAYRTLNRAAWTASTFAAGVNTNYETALTNNWRPNGAISPHTTGASGVVRISVFTNTNTGAALTSQGYKSTDGGLNYSADTFDPLSGLASGVVVPFQDTTDTTIYYGFSDGSADFNPRLGRKLLGGAHVDISPVDGSDQYGPALGQSRSFAIADDDRNTAVLVGMNSYTAPVKTGVFFTRNAESAAPTWATVVTPTTSVQYVGVYAVDRNTFILIGDGNDVLVSLMTIAADGTITVDDKTGNAVTNAYVVWICGGGA